MPTPQLPTVTYANFIAFFPEMSNTDVYTTEQFNVWLPVAVASLNPVRLFKVWTLAVCLFIAHNMVLSARAAKEAAAGATVGNVQGILTNKGVGDVNAGYDAASVAIQGAGMWNSTTYGARLYKMFQSYGTGPVYSPGPTRFLSGRGPFPVPRPFVGRG